MNAVANAAGTQEIDMPRHSGTGVASASPGMKVSDIRIDVVRREFPALALQDGLQPAPPHRAGRAAGVHR